MIKGVAGWDGTGDTGTGTSGGTQAVSQSVGKWGKEEGVRET